MTIEAMKLALEKANCRTVIMGSTGAYREGQLDALKSVCTDSAPAITALRKAIEEAEKHEWVGLTDAEILADGVLGYHFGKNYGAGPVTATGKAIIEVVEALLKEKNA